MSTCMIVSSHLFVSLHVQNTRKSAFWWRLRKSWDHKSSNSYSGDWMSEWLKMSWQSICYVERFQSKQQRLDHRRAHTAIPRTTLQARQEKSFDLGKAHNHTSSEFMTEFVAKATLVFLCYHVMEWVEAAKILYSRLRLHVCQHRGDRRTPSQQLFFQLCQSTLSTQTMFTHVPRFWASLHMLWLTVPFFGGPSVELLRDSLKLREGYIILETNHRRCFIFTNLIRAVASVPLLYCTLARPSSFECHNALRMMHITKNTVSNVHSYKQLSVLTYPSLLFWF